MKSFLKIFLCLFVKYVVFYTLLAVKNKDYYFFELSSIKDGADLFYYLWILLFLPVINFLIFSVPLFFTLKINKWEPFLLSIMAILVTEYFVYTYTSSTTDLMNGVYNAILSVLFLFLFFGKSIIQKFK